MRKVTILSIWTKREASAAPYAYDVLVPDGTTLDVLDYAVTLTNCDERPLAKLVNSTTSGDMMLLDGQHYLLQSSDPIFQPVTTEQADKIKKLTSRDTSFGLADMVANNLL